MKKRRLPYHLFRFCVSFLGLCVVLAALDEKFWVFELFAHFAVQYIGLAVLFLPFALFLRGWRMVAILLLVLGINVSEVVYVKDHFTQAPQVCEAGKTITVLQSNVFYRNWNIDKAARHLRDEALKADIVVFNEFDKEWREREGESFTKLFPYHYLTWIKGDVEKIAIFSREPFEVQQRSGRIRRNANLRLLFPAYGLTLVTYYGFSPTNENWTEERNYEIKRIAVDLKRMQSPGLVLGDFNQTPYASRMQDAMKAGDLQMAPFPDGLKPTWPVMKGLLPLEIPIDHLLVNDHIRYCDREVIKVPGSDHGAVRSVLQLIPRIPQFSNANNSLAQD